MTVALITGVSGQDGRYLARRLSSDGVEVHGVIAGPGSAEVEGVARYHQVDLSRPGIGAIVTSVQPDLVFNLAAVSSVARSWREPMTTATVNGLAVAEMLAALADLGQDGREPRFVQASSAEIFGDATSAPQSEGTPVRPVSPYGAAKAYAHLLTGMYRASGLRASSCILYNHESPLRPDTFVTRKITRAAARIRFGSQQTLELGSLDTRRDWGWAPDYVDAMIRAAAHDQPGDYVIATGVDHSIEDFVRIAFERAGVDDWRGRVVISAEFARPTDPVRLVGDAAKARAELGWVSSVDFTELVHRMVDHDLEIERPASASTSI
jgi:GDPmannose 4,6-dehydratase